MRPNSEVGSGDLMVASVGVDGTDRKSVEATALTEPDARHKVPIERANCFDASAEAAAAAAPDMRVAILLGEADTALVVSELDTFTVDGRTDMPTRLRPTRNICDYCTQRNNTAHNAHITRMHEHWECWHYDSGSSTRQTGCKPAQDSKWPTGLL